MNEYGPQCKAGAVLIEKKELLILGKRLCRRVKF